MSAVTRATEELCAMNGRRHLSSRVERRQRRRSGYSLVEVSLALLVIGIGLLAVFALFPEGLGAARRAVDDVETAAFAEFVFASLAFEAADTNESWGTFGPGVSLYRSHALEWSGQPVIVANGGFTTIASFYWLPFFYGGREWGVATYKTAFFTYKLDVADLPIMAPAKYARLEVWAGEYSSGVTPSSRGKVFYREFMPFR